MKGRKSGLFGAALLLVCFAPATFGQNPVRREFISLEAAQPVLEALTKEAPTDLRAIHPLDAKSWADWVKARDREVRERLIRGEEDTLVNLLRFGVTFTREYRIDDEYLVRYGQSSLVNSFAENRANDLIRAWRAPNPSEGLAQMRAFVQRRGYTLATPQGRAAVKKYLLDNLARLRDEYLKYKAMPKDESRYQLFQDRGISLDANLWPEHLLNLAFQSLREKGMLKPGEVKRIAIVGPGLDFANKEAGTDFYPPQTIEPFSVMDSLLRLGLAKVDTVEVDTLDISPNVNVHVERMQKAAAKGRAYVLQLPWNTERPLSEAYQASFVEYWKKLGNQIGREVAPIPVPEAAASTRTRAIEVRPEIAARVTPYDLNVVYERLNLPAERAYDLIIGTNIFVYYGDFEQSLARANVSAMLRPGGFLISNDKLPDKVPSGLKTALEVPVVISLSPGVQDTAFCYQRAN